MKITLVSHACYFIETKDLLIITDPSLYDPWGRINVACPQRKIDFTKLPKPDIIFISHSHIDHCDPKSLDYFNKDTLIIRPVSKRLDIELKILGFKNQKIFDKPAIISIGNTKLALTLSDIRSLEFGLVVHDVSGSFWNQVDTYTTHNTQSTLPKDINKFSVLAFPWQPFLQQQPLTGKPYEFPKEEYQKSILRSGGFQADLYIPAACGLRYIDDFAWLNHHTFPISHANVVHDFKNITNKECRRLLPGDVIHLHSRKVKTLEQSSPFVSCKKDDTDAISWLPHAKVNALNDDPIQQITNRDIDNVYKYFIKKELLVPASFQRWEVNVCLDIVFPRERIELMYDCADSKVHIKKRTKSNTFDIHSEIWGPSWVAHMKGEILFEELCMTGRIRNHGQIYRTSNLGIQTMMTNDFMDYYDDKLTFMAWQKFVLSRS